MIVLVNLLVEIALDRVHMVACPVSLEPVQIQGRAVGQVIVLDIV